MDDKLSVPMQLVPRSRDLKSPFFFLFSLCRASKMNQNNCNWSALAQSIPLIRPGSTAQRIAGIINPWTTSPALTAHRGKYNGDQGAEFFFSVNVGERSSGTTSTYCIHCQGVLGRAGGSMDADCCGDLLSLGDLLLLERSIVAGGDLLFYEEGSF